MVNVQRGVLQLLGAIGYLAIAFGFSTLVSGILLWATGFLPWEGRTYPALLTPLGSAMGYAIITLAMAGMAFVIAALVPYLRWLRAWVLSVVLGNLVTIAAGVNAYLIQNPST